MSSLTWALLSLKVIVLFYLKQKAKPDLGLLWTSEMELFVAIAKVPKDCILDICRGPEYPSNKVLSKNPSGGCYYILRKSIETKKHQSQQDQFWTMQALNLCKVNNTDALLTWNKFGVLYDWTDIQRYSYELCHVFCY